MLHVLSRVRSEAARRDEDALAGTTTVERPDEVVDLGSTDWILPVPCLNVDHVEAEATLLPAWELLALIFDTESEDASEVARASMRW